MVRLKRNTFYLFGGIVGFLVLGALWLSVELNNPYVIQVSLVAGIFAIYLAKRNVSDIMEDERTNLIAMKASSKTLEVFWIIFLLISISGVIIGFNRPFVVRPPYEASTLPSIPIDNIQTNEMLHLGYFGILQLVMLCLMIFLYVGFRMYYARKYGEWDEDEESD